MHSNTQPVSGFSRLSKTAKLRWIVNHFFRDPEVALRELKRFWLTDESQQQIIDGFSENTISNFILPYSVAPNFLINGQMYCIPMAIEESSVVAAAASAAKYWMDRGGIQAKVISTVKKGQVHFLWNGDREKLMALFPDLEKRLRTEAALHTANMEKRGGGITAIRLLPMFQVEKGYYQLDVDLQTCDSMGANFINTTLECFAQTITDFVESHPAFAIPEREIRVIMSILSNYTPECIVTAEVACPVSDLGTFPGNLSPDEFARKFEMAVRIAHHDPYRATTHNKGIFNGIDAVVIATGNDFRAVEACGHAYAARDGRYRSLSHCHIEHGIFRFGLELPLALGTVGGLTVLHPLARHSLEMLGTPSAEELMAITAAVGLMQNFAAVRSLVTTGIQHGHMKMHLPNILACMDATDTERTAALNHFKDRTVTYQGVRDYLQHVRSEKPTFAPES
jgi:hydroxymethylglutaryl-CoA reductase